MAGNVSNFQLIKRQNSFNCHTNYSRSSYRELGQYLVHQLKVSVELTLNNSKVLITVQQNKLKAILKYTIFFLARLGTDWISFEFFTCNCLTRVCPSSDFWQTTVASQQTGLYSQKWLQSRLTDYDINKIKFILLSPIHVCRGSEELTMT